MPYGHGQSIGTGYNPAMNIVDYQPWVAGQTMLAQAKGDAVSQVAQSAAQGISVGMDMNQQNKELSATKKSTEMMIDSAMNLYGDMIPGLKDQFTAVKAQMNDPSISLYEQAAIGKSMSSSITDLLNMQVQRMQLDMQQQRLNQMNQPAGQLPDQFDWRTMGGY